MWHNNAEKHALHEKYSNHKKRVQCPTCGIVLVYKKVETSDYAACPKCRISFGTRGF